MVRKPFGSATGRLHDRELDVAPLALGRGYDLDAFDADCAATGLIVAERYSTWAADPFLGGDYAVSVMRVSKEPN